ncbi:MAG: hypothetical protein HC826_01870, partial [Rhodospirillales bacterium]|nr:hypothetical protein [Rhodospirillales bacterium]
MLTTHRRENFGAVMSGHLQALRRFVDSHEDIALVFPVHLNPAVREVAHTILEGNPRIRLIPPLYPAGTAHLRRRCRRDQGALRGIDLLIQEGMQAEVLILPDAVAQQVARGAAA